MFDDPFPSILDRPMVEMEFRDGRRLVIDYLASMMAGFETHRLTYEEAVQAANKQVEADYLNAQRGDVLAAHFRERR